MSKAFSINNEIDNVIYYEINNSIINGQVYSGYLLEDGTAIYHHKRGSIETNNIKAARNLFNFSYRWRGVWEGRVYFKDDEYWGEEVESLSELWGLIKNHCELIIKSIHPDYFE